MEIKLGDVYSFSYNDEWYNKINMPYHCFDGIMFVRQKEDGSFCLEDTYWSSDNRIYTLEQALKYGTLSLICNINEVEKCNEDDYKYYNANDIFNLSYQHGCYPRFYKRKGALRSPEVMEEIIKRQIEELKQSIGSAKYNIQRKQELLEKLKSGDTSFYY